MVKAVVTYARERFSPLLFGALALFLFLFAKGRLSFETSDYFLLPLLLFLLFLFRLFDDLQNKEFDQQKPGRSYTGAEHHAKLQSFFSSASVIVFAVLFTIKPIAGAVLLGFFFLNLLLYKMLLKRWKFRNLLPLLKYPCLYFLLLFLIREQPPGLFETGAAMALFTAFVLYENLTDNTFPVARFLQVLLFIAIFLPFFPAFAPTLPGLFLTSSVIAAFLGLLFFRHKTLPYLLLLLLLFSRLILPL